MSIPFTQFIGPDGRKQPMVIDMPPDVEEKAAKVIAAGGHFTSEVLSTGIVSLACEFEDEDIAHELCKNDISILDAVKSVVENALTFIEEKQKG